MKDKSYWKRYPILTNPEEIEQALSKEHFHSEGHQYELLRFFETTSSINILITPGSGGHAYVFAELGYLIHKQGFNVFIMPKHGGFTISELCKRHIDAVRFIRSKYSGGLHIYGEGLGGLVNFYIALAGVSAQSIICENSPAILTDKAFHAAMKSDGAAGKRRTLLLPFFKVLVKLFPLVPVPIKFYLDWNELIDVANKKNKAIEERLVEAYSSDPDFDRHYPLKAVMSLISTPPPKPISTLSIPTMFILTRRGLMPGYFRQLFNQLNTQKKTLREIDGGVFWMVSNPGEAAAVIADWALSLEYKREPLPA